MIKETPRLYIRHLLERDANRLVEYRNKEEVARYQSWDHYTYDEADRKRTRLNSSHRSLYRMSSSA